MFSRKHLGATSSSGVALVIVLAFVILLAGIVVAYLARTSTDRQLAHGTFNESNANQLARSALDVIVGDLKQEIVDGSTSSSLSGVTIYTPTSATNMIPMRSGNPSGSPDPIPNLVRRSVRSDPIASPGVPSRASNLNSAPSPSPSPAIAKKGQISTARWNKHYLIPKTNTVNDQTDPVASFTAPDWVIVTKNGPKAFDAWDSTLRDTASANFALGRYAYVIYDEGGLLDVNVAGYPVPTPAPASSPPQPYVFKGALAYSDLTPNPGVNISQQQVNNIVGWRNYASTQPDGNFQSNFSFTTLAAQRYFNFVTASTGYLTVPTTTSAGRTDQAFVSRQQLIEYRKSTQFSVNGLQYLGTFSRETNSPTLRPGSPTATNPDFTTIRATSNFARFDGTSAVVGEPLVKTRFPLSRLAWITFKGPSADVYASNTIPPYDPVIAALLNSGVSLTTIRAGTPTNIQKCFGLTYASTDLWTYSHGATDRILTVSEVVTAARDPDFFELLQAAILTGSLGQNTGGGVTGGSVFPDVHMSNTAHHILSIGASIIDQADPDSIPTRVQFNPSGTMWIAYGIESLPYITQMYALAGISPDNTTDPNPWAIYLLFQVWNPHQNVPSATPTPAPPAPNATPPTVRLRVDGGLGVFKGGNGEAWTNSGTDRFFNASGQSIVLNLSPAFAPSPAPLTTLNTTGAALSTVTGAFVPLPSPPAASPTPGPLVGFRLPDFSYPTPAPTPTATPTLWLQIGASTGTSLSTKNTFNATMEIDVGDGINIPVGTFIPYNRFIGINDSSSWITDDPIQLRTANSRAGAPRPFTATQLTQTPPPAFLKADPRSTRFGIVQISATATNPAISEPLWSTATSLPNGYGGAITDGSPPNAAGVVEHAPKIFASALPSPYPYYPATLALNNGPTTATRTTYADNDGTVRPADSNYPEPTPAANPTPRYSTAYYPSPAPAPSPTPPSNTSLQFNDYKPVILNRPFRSIAELGYAFRDLPWKTLDFFTDTSADAGLLDVFCINDGPPIYDSQNPPNIIGMAVPALVAGSVNLNTRQAPILQSLLAGTLLAELDANDTISKTGISATAAPVIAANLVTATAATPFRNVSELITRSGLPTTVFPVPLTGSAHDQRVKNRREVVARALSSVAQTRTWNLMIDVIAQSGRYPPNATGLDQFLVEGEKRYWLHVAIDRFTGEIIDQQLEAVYE